MSRSLNKALLIGNVGSEPNIRTLASGAKLATASLATNRKAKDQEHTSWHRILFWNRLADLVAQYVHKGDRLYVEGRIEYSQAKDPETGETRYYTDIWADQLIMLGSGSSSEGPRAPKHQREPAGPFGDDDSDLPF